MKKENKLTFVFTLFLDVSAFNQEKSKIQEKKEKEKELDSRKKFKIPRFQPRCRVDIK